MSGPRTSIPDTQLQHILRGQLAADLAMALQEQEPAFLRGEKLVVTGSSLPFLLDYTGMIDLPRYRPPSDLDFCLQDVQPDHRKFASSHMRTMSRMLQEAADVNGFSVSSLDIENNEFILSKKFSIAEAADALSERSLAKRLPDFALKDAIREEVDVKLPVQFLPFSTALLPPEPFAEIQPGFICHGNELYRDDLRNLVARKLAQLVVLPNQIKNQQDGHTLSDVTDVYNILNSSDEAHRTMLEDPQLLRVLFVAMTGNMPNSCLRRSALRFRPDAQSVTRLHDAFRDKYGLLVSEGEIRAMLETVDHALGKLFPERSAAQPFPLTANERAYIDKIQSPYSTGENILPELLAKDYPLVFRKHAGLSDAIKTQAFTVDRVQQNQDSYLGIG